jgi:RNA polymerase sigma factor (TIGR02999 family)
MTPVVLPSAGRKGAIVQRTQASLPRLFESLADGDAAALDAIITILYDDLRHLARRQRVLWPGHHTLTTTSLVHETYLKLVRQKRIATRNSAHFLALASRAMRHVLSNYAEARRAYKRGGGIEPQSLQELALAPLDALIEEDDAVEVLAVIHEALERLEGLHARACRVVECRFFGGLTIEETAQALGTSPRTVKRDWAFSQAWLKRELGEIR